MIQPPTTKYTIIVVEDNELCLRAFSAFLDAIGFFVAEFTTCSKAIDFLAKPHPPVFCIFADLHLSGELSGIEWLMALKEVANGTPTIVITGDTSNEASSITATTGYPVLTKPFTPQMIKAILDSIANGHPPLAL